MVRLLLPYTSTREGAMGVRCGELESVICDVHVWSMRMIVRGGGLPPRIVPSEAMVRWQNRVCPLSAARPSLSVTVPAGGGGPGGRVPLSAPVRAGARRSSVRAMPRAAPAPGPPSALISARLQLLSVD